MKSSEQKGPPSTDFAVLARRAAAEWLGPHLLPALTPLPPLKPSDTLGQSATIPQWRRRRRSSICWRAPLLLIAATMLVSAALPRCGKIAFGIAPGAPTLR